MSAATHRQDRMDLNRQWRKDQETLQAVIEGSTTAAVLDILGVCPRKVCQHSSEVHTVAFRPNTMVVQCQLCPGELRACFSWNLPAPTRAVRG